MSKRVIINLFLVLFLTIMVLMAVGCGQEAPVSQPGSPGDKSPSPDETGMEKAITVGEAQFPTNMDAALGWNGWYTVKYGIGETLVRLTTDMELEPWLAETWTQDDDFTWRLQIREGVYFTNGEELTAEKVKASLDRALELNTRAPSLLDIQQIEAQGSELIITTNNPNPALVSNLTDPLTAIVDADAAREMGDDFAMEPVMTGPFILTSFVPDEEVIVEKNPDYWGVEAGLDRAIFRLIPDAGTRLMALQAGEVQMAVGLPEEAHDVLAREGNHQIMSQSTARSHILIFNLQKPVFSDKAVRLAVNKAINRDDLADKLMKGQGVSARGPFPLVLPFGGDQLEAYPYDPEKAAGILDDAGWKPGSNGIRQKGGQKLEFTIVTYAARPELPIIGETIQSQLKKVGIDVQVSIVDGITDYLKSGDFDASIYSINTAITGDPQYFLEIFFRTGADSNFGGYSNPQMDELINRLTAKFEMPERYEVAREAQQMILNDAAFAFLVYPKYSVAVHNNIKGFEIYPSEFYFLFPRMTLE